MVVKRMASHYRNFNNQNLLPRSASSSASSGSIIVQSRASALHLKPIFSAILQTSLFHFIIPLNILPCLVTFSLLIISSFVSQRIQSHSSTIQDPCQIVQCSIAFFSYPYIISPKQIFAVPSSLSNNQLSRFVPQ